MIINTLTRVINIILRPFFQSRTCFKMWLQLDNKHLLVQTIQWNYCNNKINSSASQKLSSWPYHSLEWLFKVMEINKVTRNTQFTIVYLPPLMLQENCIKRTVFWCLPLTFVLWSQVKLLNWSLSNYVLLLWNITLKMKNGRIENNSINITRTNSFMIKMQSK